MQHPIVQAAGAFQRVEATFVCVQALAQLAVDTCQGAVDATQVIVVTRAEALEFDIRAIEAVVEPPIPL